MLVFQDTYHKGWKARLGDESLPQFKVFSSMNGYWVTSETAINADSLVLNFAPQSRYRRAQIISGLAFLVVVGILLSPVAWRRWLRKTKTGARLDMRAKSLWSSIAPRLPGSSQKAKNASQNLPQPRHGTRQ